MAADGEVGVLGLRLLLVVLLLLLGGGGLGYWQLAEFPGHFLGEFPLQFVPDSLLNPMFLQLPLLLPLLPLPLSLILPIPKLPHSLIRLLRYSLQRQ